MRVLQHTISKPEPTENVKVLKQRHVIRMRFVDLGTMIADSTYADQCVIEYRWADQMVDFRFQDSKIGNKNVVVRVKMSDSDETIFEKFTQAQEYIEKLKEEYELKALDE